MLKGFILGVVLIVLCCAGAAYAVLSFGLIPANADATPGALESFAAKTDLRAVLSNEAPKHQNPVMLNDTNLIAGIKLYGTHCAICHGTAVGEDSRSAIARGEYPKPPQLASNGVEDDPQGWTFWKIKHGIRWTGMPSWKHELHDRQIWTLALFLKYMDKLPPSANAAWQSLSGSHPGT